MKPTPRRFCLATSAALLVQAALALPAAAVDTAGTGLPWDRPLEVVRENITGPTVTALILIAIAAALAVWAMSDDQRGLMRFGKAVAALAIIGTLVPFLLFIGVQAAAV